MSLRRSSSLKNAIVEWLGEGLISDQTAQTLIARYELDADPPWYRDFSFLVTIVAVLLVTMGLTLAISENWDSLGIPTRVATGAVPWVLSAALCVWYLVKGRERLAEVWGVACSLLFGVNIFLQAQIFHISGYAPNALMWWMIGVLPLAFTLRSHVLVLLAQILATIWVGMESSNDVGTIAAIPALAVIVLATRLALNEVTLTGLIVAFLTMLHNVGYLIYDTYQPERIVLSLVSSFLLGMALVSISTSTAPRYRSVMHWIGVTLLVIMAFIFSSLGTDGGLEMIATRDWYGAVLCVVAAMILLWKDRGALTFVGVAIALWFTMGTFLTTWDDASGRVFIYGLNMILFAGAVAMITMGISVRQKAWFMGGLVLIVAHALIRYVDLFGDYIVTSIIFVLAGIALIGANRLWKARFNG